MALNTTNNQNPENPYTVGTRDYDEYEKELQRQKQEQQDKERQNTLYKNKKGETVINPDTGKPFTQYERDMRTGNLKKRMDQKYDDYKKRHQVQATGRGPDTNTNIWQAGVPWEIKKEILEELKKDGDLTEDDLEILDVELGELEAEIAKHNNPNKDENGNEIIPSYPNVPDVKAEDFSNNNNNQNPEKPKEREGGLGTYQNIDVDSMFADKKTKGFPRSIWQAWKDGEFGTWINADGTINEEAKKNAEQIRNNLILDSVLTAIGNGIRGFDAGLNNKEAYHQDSLWQERQAENFRKDTDRGNAQLDAFKQAETDLGLANVYSNLTPAQKQGLADAWNMFKNGRVSDAETLLRNTIGDEEYAKWTNWIENTKVNLAVRADQRAQDDQDWRHKFGIWGIVGGIAGKVADKIW